MSSAIFSEVIMRQCGGLGDILFCLRIAEEVHKKYNCSITWPILSTVPPLSEYLDCPYINWTAWDDEVDAELRAYGLLNHGPFTTADNRLILPLDTAIDGIQTVFSEYKAGIMEAKYDLMRLSHENWQDSIKLKRNTERESSLYYDVLGLKDDQDYTFSCRWYQTPLPPCNMHPRGRPSLLSEFMDIDKFEQPVIELQFMPEYNALDWLMVIERAKHIEVVSTCWIYIIEAMNTRCNEINMYPRDSPCNCMQLFFMKKAGLRKQWNFANEDIYYPE